MEYFRAEKVSDSTTRIFGATGELMYLVEGTNEALLLDAGVGVGDLAAFVGSLTAKPLRLALTHGHMDHSGGAPLFERVYLNQADHALAGTHASDEGRWEYVRLMLGKDLPEEAYVPLRELDYLPLEDGDVFELGGTTVQMLALPGHTKGSMCALVRQERAVLFGDACNPFVFLFDEETATVPEYRANLQRFKAAHEDKYDRVYLSHGPGDIDKGILDSVMEVCDDILAGKVDDVPFPFMGGLYQVAKAFDDITRMRTDGKLGNIVYSKSRLAAEGK